MRDVAQIKWFVIGILFVGLILVFFNCTKEKVIIYKSLPDKVKLVSPPNTGLEFLQFPVLSWEQLDGAVSYEINISKSVNFLSLMVDEAVADTFFSYTDEVDDDTYYWRVRAKNSDDIWSDWSDASIWSFSINNSNDYLALVAVAPTFGIAQDVRVVEEAPDSIIAYIADAQLGLTVYNVTDAANPTLIGNLDPEQHDYAYSVWKLPGQEMAFMADNDGKMFGVDVRLPFDPFSPRHTALTYSQNVAEIYGTVFRDTLYMFVGTKNQGHREIGFWQIVFDVNGFPNPGDYYNILPRPLPADCQGVFVDSMSITVEYYDADRESTYYEEQDGMFVFAGATQAGVWWYDVSTTHSFSGEDTLMLRGPRTLGWQDSPSVALRLFARDGFVYLADDRGGLQIYDLPDTIPAYDHEEIYDADPELVADINTSGRTKDVHVVGNYCYLADGSGGLKVVDITDPYSPVFLDAYSTPYAYGVYATQDYIYICDRDNGLMIFESGDLVN